jgi:hypothetical protein
MTTPTTFIAFMCHTSLDRYDYLEQTLQEYNIGQYLIGYEASPYEHYHFLAQMTTADYHLFSERVFRKKLKLKGRATKDNPRQYGKVKKIEDLEKMKSYTLKDGNYRSNMPEQDVAKYFENSYKKEEKKKVYEQVKEHLDESLDQILTWMYSDIYSNEPDYIRSQLKYIKLNIINYLRITTDINMCRSNINSYTQYFLKHTSLLEDTEKDKFLYYLLF